jgi:murein DD-endopeptidase MepM/ murein hydrolase activator NlpD
MGRTTSAFTGAVVMAAALISGARTDVPSAVSAGFAAAPVAASRPVHYTAPVSPLRVVRAFDPPEHEFGAGHLGVDLATSRDAVVSAAGDGVVAFAGSVAGRGVVVVRHADGISTEYEPVQPLVSRGATVRGGQPLGRVRGTHGTCAPDRCLHWGARRDDQYLDPLLLLQALAPVRLLPWRDPGG